MPLNILFVDDEQSLLDGIRRTLHRKQRAWKIFYAQSGQQALDYLEGNPCDLIVTDMRMPEMSGDELLRIVREKHPNIIRFILTGFTERELILDSIGLAHQIFSKPCNPEFMAEAINYANSLYQDLADERVQKVVCDIKNLPTPPNTYMALIAEFKKKEAGIERLVKVIKNDSAVSTKVLQMVNSAYFGLGEPVADIAQATMFLGIENLKSVVLAVEVTDESFKNLRWKFDLNQYSHHSVKVGAFSEKLAKILGLKQKQSQTAFTSGLLHDIGKLVMVSYFDKLYLAEKACMMAHPDTVDTEAIELDKFGVSHSELGAALAGIWGLPPSIVNAIAYHHNPRPMDDHTDYPAMVHVANAVALMEKDQTLESLYQKNLLNESVVSRLNWEDEIHELIYQSRI